MSASTYTMTTANHSANVLLAEVSCTSQASIDNVRRADSFGSDCLPPSKISIAAKGLSLSHVATSCGAVSANRCARSATPEEQAEGPVVVRIRRNDPYAFQCIGEPAPYSSFAIAADCVPLYVSSIPYYVHTAILRGDSNFDDINASISSDSVGYPASTCSAEVTPTKRRSPRASLSASPVNSFEFPSAAFGFCTGAVTPAGNAPSQGRKHRREAIKRTLSIADILPHASPLASAHNSLSTSPSMELPCPSTPLATSSPATPAAGAGKLSRGYCNGRPIPIRTGN